MMGEPGRVVKDDGERERQTERGGDVYAVHMSILYS